MDQSHKRLQHGVISTCLEVESEIPKRHDFRSGSAVPSVSKRQSLIASKTGLVAGILEAMTSNEQVPYCIFRVHYRTRMQPKYTHTCLPHAKQAQTNVESNKIIATDASKF